ncbi:substrate-binding domain-containing protein [Salegentibacter salegens]|uniref:ABC-type nitrate/sulfonate/bicarbonate transport system, substrate-binding protein n=1 Tax=Salegentibacter salegens TaxID=143223 RepID=A0A1M7J6V5_9FLAO|nr:substrate-binding domain-containing protein [Salegentibacter salegens]PRX47338.1 ABC-type nitrate/sulfonate/bicarbonate transport system substrate-binding protein [Salegentibacter salegens]SHM48672.1 ABC-type nitrate/sulfonate/bicarbonate transport system, substrate-binding protein [Salegentibacter salegens]
MKTIKVGGVPEHFNLPWHLCIEEKLFEARGINVIWKDFPGGTGAMNKALRAGEIDAAVILTEGILKDIISGNESKIIQTYIGSPLVWGIHVAAASKYKSVEELKNTKAAISRKGSGSHLMAYVNAQNHTWNTEELEFEIVKDLDGAVEALKNDKAQYFMWEHFTTKPLVDNHTFRRLADCPTPWPCFVIAARNESLKNEPDRLKTMLEILNRETQRFKNLPKIAEKLSENYDQRLEDIEKWLNITHWSQEQITENEVEKVQDKLLELNLISKKQRSSEFIHNL